MPSQTQTQPLLPNGSTTTAAESARRKLVSTLLVPVILLAGLIFVAVKGDGVPKDPLELARYYLKSSPVIDGHVDLPIFAREFYGNDINKFDLNKEMPAHFDIPRARAGGMGGMFWSIYADCPAEAGQDFLNPTNTVRDTLETFDLSINLIRKYDDTFKMCLNSEDVEAAVKEGKIASLFGMEGAHMLGNSLGVLRMYHLLGMRYLTLTHACNNAFADSAFYNVPLEEAWGGLSSFGKELIKELNRLGIFVDLSHVSDKTALQALSLTRAPVIWSHSDARHFKNMSRNAPDVLFEKLGKGKGKVDGVVMVNFYPAFASEDPKTADASTIADQVEYIAQKAGKSHVGIGSDFDGIESVPKDLKDVSQYPNLFAELIRRGWSQHDLAGLAGGNLIRAMKGMEDAAKQIQKEGKGPNMATYDKRTDLGRHRQG